MSPDAPPHALARTLRVLNGITPDKSSTFRILFYGQSITRDAWTAMVDETLRKTFPDAHLVTSNLAVGGFAAQRLIHVAERDLREFYPDLVIFHVYGSHGEYESVLRMMRAFTTADIAIQTDHYAAGPVKPLADDSGWHAFMNAVFLPAVATHYNAALIDVRSAWFTHLKTHHLPAEALLRDQVHLNTEGNTLMARIVSDALAQPTTVNSAEPHPWIHDVNPGAGTDWHRNILRMEFEGNRVVALPDPGPVPAKTSAADVLIDGQPPSRIPDTFLFTRPNAGPHVDWPWEVSAPIRITSAVPPVEEEWTITVTAGNREEFAFRVVGSITGPDGEGSSKTDFVSDSRRVQIAAEHWWTQETKTVRSPIAPGYQWTFRAFSNGTDVLNPAELHASPGGVVLASGLRPGRHVLELRIPDGATPPPVRAFRIHRPPLWGANVMERPVADTLRP